MRLPGGRVVIELAPPFAPNHVANIKTLVREHYFDGLSILRSQDNFVVQFGDPDEKNPRPLGSAKASLKAEFSAPIKADSHFTRLKDFDGYAPQVGHSNGFPVGHDPKAGRAWLAHCYGMLGVGRNNDADSGSGTELYVVTGHAPRQLDRNITVVGRVIDGMPLLAVMARGTAPGGMYDKPDMYVPITSIKLAADVPEAERSKLEIMRTDSASFQQAVEAQRNRVGPFYKRPAGYIELCNAPIPVRQRK
jgi:peptidylprolyl isomerase